MLRRHFLPTLAAAALARPLAAQARKDRQVIVISIDGLPAYAFSDPNFSMPAVRRLGKEGAVAEGMRTVNPAVTWPNHTSMVTGVSPSKHGVLFNGLPVRNGEGKPLRVEPWVPKHDLVQAITVYDLAFAAGLRTAEVDWVAIQQPKTIHHSFAERPTLEDAIPREMIAAGIINENDISTFAKTNIVRRDEIWTDAGVHILRKHKPNLLLFHLLATESGQHRYGARSLGAYTSWALADAHIRRLVEAAGPNATFIVVSDHGFKTYDKIIRPNAWMAAKGMSGDVYTIPEGGSAMVYITRASKKAELAPKVRAELTSLQGVSRIIEPSEYQQFGFPPPNERMADFVILAEDRYAFDGTETGEPLVDVPAGSTPGAHGYVNTDPAMNAAFVASGAGIKKGVKLGVIRNLDVAPTIAHLLGLEMKNIEGQPLSEILV
jgi:predicted AlkP superfamily pyrophosphatase or phosphodiesterase